MVTVLRLFADAVSKCPSILDMNRQGNEEREGSPIYTREAWHWNITCLQDHQQIEWLRHDVYWCVLQLYYRLHVSYHLEPIGELGPI